MTPGRKFGIWLGTLAVAVCGLWLGFAPTHWMTKGNFASVLVDDRTVPADVYIGNPTYYESDAISLVHVPGVGDYFLNFDDESYREISHHEFVRLPGGAWTLKAMDDGQFSAALPDLNINEFRLRSHGHTVIVQF